MGLKDLHVHDLKTALSFLNEKPYPTLGADLAPFVAVKLMLQEAYGGLTADECVAINLYSAEAPAVEPFYACLNVAMRAENRHLVRPFLRIIKLLLSGLYKLPLVCKPLLARGVKLDLSAQYKVGELKLWWPFSSTTTNLNTLEVPQFLGDSGPRTLFQIINAPAVDIKPLSANDFEDEWLLLPGTFFTVKSVTATGDGLVIVVLEFKKLPPMLDYVHPQWPAPSA